MVIRILPSLNNRQQWIDFCSRELSYCFIETPSTLVDFQSTLLIITLLPKGLKDGRKAIKYSIGSAQTVKPAWDFIKGCNFDLQFMIDGLNTIDFASNARDNHHLGFCPQANVRKFYSKESSVIAPDTTGAISPLTSPPDSWLLDEVIQVIANRQFTDLRSEKLRLNEENESAVDIDNLLLNLIEEPKNWHIRLRNKRLWLIKNAIVLYSLLPDLTLAYDNPQN